MGISLDFTNVSSGFEVLPEGNYDATVAKVEVRNTKSGDSQYLNFEWDVIDENGKERKVWDIASLKPQALWKLKGIMEAFGMITEGSIDLDPEEFVGQSAVLELAIDTYNGKERNVVKTIKGSVGAVANGTGI